ncbi:MAG: hypothetical protein M1838_002351 [Thelocarpon superellum]|nr:MAG: hypothetical protein M1838_002351 [Thelocarpon superellum]
MSEVQSRPAAPRGRGSSRGGRGGYGSRGGARGGSRPAVNGTKADHTTHAPVEEEGEVGELKKQYSTKLATAKELFPDWTDEDLVYALQETNGDLEGTVERITDGSISQWGEVKKKTKDRSRSKVKDAGATTSADTAPVPTARGSRSGRGGADGARAARGRASERGRAHGRGGRTASLAATNGHRSSSTKDGAEAVLETSKASVPTDESPAWDQAVASEAAATTDGTPGDGWNATSTAPPQTTAAAAERPSTSVIPGGTTKSWASMFAKPAPVPVVRKTTGPLKTAKATADAKTTALPPSLSGSRAETEKLPTPLADDSDAVITPSTDALTETNLEQVLDASAPPVSATAASTVASSREPRAGVEGDTPFSTAAQTSSRPPTSGFAATAFKATGGPGRTSSFQRRVLDQQEAVVMPGNAAVDRAAVQFGSLGLNGAPDELDVDEEREEAETRAQPPQHSPVAHPRASLPPAPNHGVAAPHADAKDSEPAVRPAPGLPPVPSAPPAAAQHASPQQAAVGPPSMAAQTSQSSQQYGQFNRYAPPTMQPEAASSAPKPYDPFGQPSHQSQAQPNQYEAYLGQMPGQQGQPPPHQPSHPAATFSSAPNDYSSYYTADQQRGAYQNYYGSQYGQQAGQSQQEAGAGQARSGSGYGQSAADSLSQYATSQAQPPQSRYPTGSDTATSGPNDASTATPGLSVPPQGQSAQPQATAQQMQGQQSQGQASGHNNYPYGHPYFSSPYYTAYMNQFGYGQGYNAPYGGKGGMYGQPHQNYGMTSQSSYEHSSSPANVGGFAPSSQHGRDAGAGPSVGVGEYGRSGSAQTPQNPSHGTGSGAFGGVPDVFGRSGFHNQNVPLHQHQGHPPAGGEDSMKSFGEAKAGAGPSPLLHQAGRPGSATNNGSGSNVSGQAAPSGLAQTPSGNQSGFGGYPSHLNPHLHGNQGAQYSGLGGLGAHQGGAQNHQGSGYGQQYGSGYGGSYYGGSGRGGGAAGAGWGGNYGGH